MLWRDQIVRDISLVFDSNEFAHDQLIKISKEQDHVSVSNAISDIYYQAIYSFLDGEGSEQMQFLGRSLIENICSNLGIDVFDDLAAEWVSE